MAEGGDEDEIQFLRTVSAAPEPRLVFGCVGREFTAVRLSQDRGGGGEEGEDAGRCGQASAAVTEGVGVVAESGPSDLFVWTRLYGKFWRFRVCAQVKELPLVWVGPCFWTSQHPDNKGPNPAVLLRHQLLHVGSVLTRVSEVRIWF